MGKLIYIIFFIISTSVFYGQEKIIEVYKNAFGETIRLENDSIFFHSFEIGGISNTMVGKWKILNDTLYLKTVLDLNKLRESHSSNINKKKKEALIPDSKQISEQPENISKKNGTPEKLFFKDGKLYLIMENGKIDKGKSMFKESIKK